MGCAETREISTDRIDEDAGPSISWLTRQLTDEGVFIQAKGPANFDLRAEESSRLVLNGEDVIDVYYYESETDAEQEAVEFTAAYPSLHVYRKSGLVVVRYTDRADGLAGTFRKIMGPSV